MNPDRFKAIVSHCKEYGFVFPSSEIYDGLGAVYDYGPYGVQLKNRIREYWWRAMTQLNENIVGIDAAIFMHPAVWKASGHVDAFNDPLIDNKDSKKRYRADVLIEEYIAKLEARNEKEAEKAQKRFGDAFDREKFLATNPNVLRNSEKINEVNGRMKAALDGNDLTELKQLIVDLEIADPESGSKNWTDVRQFNLMFATKLGSVTEGANEIYLRPETAQGIFVNYLNVQKTTRQKLPFGIAQVGKAFRNEIVARQWLFRMREFEQMEMQFFVKPGEEMRWYNHWREQRKRWHMAMGIPEARLKFQEHLKLAHYANAAVDIQYDFPIGFKEVEGIHSRTDFDLGQHQEYSGKKLQYFDPETEQSYVPFVVETSIGLDRTFLMVISEAYDEDTVEGETRTVLRFRPELAPVQAAILPLVRKDGLPEMGLDIFKRLRLHVNCQYEDKDSIGKRYRRQDAIGTPWCLTVDHQSLQDNRVTIRERDSMKQERIPIDKVEAIVTEKTSLDNLLKQLAD
jgi:glycyl-tRNA synthetase